ncbi:uncharacterized protein LOC117332508 [Pecten maximus]|uniref:uncharacterized protein LOC117332508 n=1 Tax=Pecten maximus TaxID=6579 RepID=UPI001458BA28|nr:uncharacterized protein LOC117332508 [Pecten maximus]
MLVNMLNKDVVEKLGEEVWTEFASSTFATLTKVICGTTKDNYFEKLMHNILQILIKISSLAGPAQGCVLSTDSQTHLIDLLPRCSKENRRLARMLLRKANPDFEKEPSGKKNEGTKKKKRKIKEDHANSSEKVEVSTDIKVNGEVGGSPAKVKKIQGKDENVPVKVKKAKKKKDVKSAQKQSNMMDVTT